MTDFNLLEWVHPGHPFKLTYDEPGDWALSKKERERETVRRIRNYLYAISIRQPAKEAA